MNLKETTHILKLNWLQEENHPQKSTLSTTDYNHLPDDGEEEYPKKLPTRLNIKNALTQNEYNLPEYLSLHFFRETYTY